MAWLAQPRFYKTSCYGQGRFAQKQQSWPNSFKCNLNFIAAGRLVVQILSRMVPGATAPLELALA
jgi:hypothetical protein